jgi:tRNA-2-methylthio-N6-dimethylallyladenosine synthase
MADARMSTPELAVVTGSVAEAVRSGTRVAPGAAPAAHALRPDGSARRLYMETVGCQMNELDSELVIAQLRRHGYVLVDSPSQADTVLFNTCSVRQHAEDKIYSALGRLKHLKKQRPDLTIGVLGCMAQKDQKLILRRAPHVDLIVGPGQLDRVPDLIDEARASRSPQMAVSLARNAGSRDTVTSSFTAYDADREPEQGPSGHQAYVRVMMGCDKFCTYCIVPAVRGPEQSRPPEVIVEEAKRLLDQGKNEITLLGQTVNSYHFRQPDGRIARLSDLLYRIHDLPGLERIKFVTSFPLDMTDDLLQAVRDLPKASKYLHVPAQSGCDVMLKRMKRLYTVADYEEMLARIRGTIPESSVSSDFIVGFPGETEESFEKSVALVERARFKNSFIFKYSTRPGTKAHDLFPDDIPEETKKQRNNRLLEVQARVSEEDHQSFIGREMRILVEGLSKTAAGRSEAGPVVQLAGRTWCDRIVVFDGNERLTGRVVSVRITGASAVTLFGAIVTADLHPVLEPGSGP